MEGPVVARRASRAERRARTRDRLLEAAARVFARRGFAGASLDEIAEEAGFTKGAVYSNFTGKDELFLTVLEQHLDRRMSSVRATFAETGTLADVRAGGRATSRHLGSDPEVWRLFLEFWLHATRDPHVRERVGALYGSMRDTIGRLIAGRFERAGIPLPAPASDLGGAAIALAEGHLLQRQIDPERIGDEVYGEMLAYLVAGMAVAGLDLDVDALGRLRPEAAR
jgi:AcrR family transcriptional regulator